MTPFRLPDGTLTKKGEGRSRKGKDFNKTKLVNSFPVQGKDVLDIGCSEGMYSFYLARNGANVTGIDIDPVRISNANHIKLALGFDSVRFIHGSVLNLFDFTTQKFDLVLAYGFLHRMPDPINFILNAGSIGKNICLEWRAPALLPTSSLGIAIHNPGGRWEWKNLSNFDSLEFMEEAFEKKEEVSLPLADFWRISPATVVDLLSSIGFRRFELTVIQKEYRWRLFPKTMYSLVRSSLSRGVRPCDWPHSQRVHLFASRDNHRGELDRDLNKNLQIADWDGRFS